MFIASDSCANVVRLPQLARRTSLSFTTPIRSKVVIAFRYAVCFALVRFAFSCLMCRTSIVWARRHTVSESRCTRKCINDKLCQFVVNRFDSLKPKHVLQLGWNLRVIKHKLNIEWHYLFFNVLAKIGSAFVRWPDSWNHRNCSNCGKVRLPLCSLPCLFLFGIMCVICFS